MNTIEHIPHDVSIPLRVYACDGSYLIPGHVVERLAAANHESEANAVFIEKAPFVPTRDRCHVWQKCR